VDILALISRLIDYPETEATEELCAAKNEIEQLINNDELLCDDDKAGLISFIEGRTSMEILDWQSEYDALFERGRSLSLFLFEHLHGESRDRGQAMIDLIAEYKKAGLDIGIRELPDYIPLFLEFASTQGENNARGWLQDVSHILALLKVRLEQRECDYAILFSVLVRLAKTEINFDDIAVQVKGEKRDDTNAAIDKVWEEEMVKFGPDSSSDGCSDGTNKPSQSQRRDQNVPITMMNPKKVDNNLMNSVIEETLAKEKAQEALRTQSTAVGGN